LTRQLRVVKATWRIGIAPDGPKNFPGGKTISLSLTPGWKTGTILAC